MRLAVVELIAIRRSDVRCGVFGQPNAPAGWPDRLREHK